MTDIPVHRLAQVGGKARGGVGHTAPREDAEDQREEGHAEHDGSIEIHVLHAAGIQSLVDERGRHIGYQHVHHHLHRRPHRG